MVGWRCNLTSRSMLHSRQETLIKIAMKMKPLIVSMRTMGKWIALWVWPQTSLISSPTTHTYLSKQRLFTAITIRMKKAAARNATKTRVRSASKTSTEGLNRRARRESHQKDWPLQAIMMSTSTSVRVRFSRRSIALFKNVIYMGMRSLSALSLSTLIITRSSN